MDKLSLEDYKIKITNASAVGLVVINYEIILHFIDEAKKVIESANANLTFDDKRAIRAEAEKFTDKALKFVNELILSLNMEIPISITLYKLYVYVNKLLINAAINLDVNSLTEANQIMSPLCEAFRSIENEQLDNSPVVDNAQQIYAGLTYGKGSLTESVISENNRGFKV